MRLKQHVNEHKGHKGTWLLFRFEINTTIVVLVVKPKKGNRCTTTTPELWPSPPLLSYMYIWHIIMCIVYILFCTCFIYLYRERPENGRQNKFIDYIMYLRPSSRIVVVATVDLSVVARAVPVRPLISTEIFGCCAVLCGLECGWSIVYYDNMVINYNALNSNRVAATIDQ